MKNTKTIISIIVMGLISQNVAAKSDDLPSIGISTTTAAQPSNYDLKMIYQPSQYLLERERNGHVNIYDGLKNNQVNQILDDNFSRIVNMMFTRVKLTDEYGEVMIDAETGYEVVADDGCDD